MTWTSISLDYTHCSNWAQCVYYVLFLWSTPYALLLLRII